MRTPNPLRAFTVRQTNTGDIIQGVYLVIFGFVHRFMQLRYCRDYLRR